MTLTNAECKRLKSKNKEYKVFDGGSLYLLVKPNGGKYWRMNYRFLQKSKTLAIGVYPEISLKEAREARENAKQLLRKGKDPSLEKRKVRALQSISYENTFGAIASEWLSIVEERCSTRHFKRCRSIFINDINPIIGSHPVQDIKAPLLLIVIRKIESRGSLSIAQKGLAFCGQVFRYAIATGRADRNIANDLQGALKTRRVQHFKYLKEHELSDFFIKLSKFDGEPLTALALELIILTMVRTSEIRFAPWVEFQNASDTWIIDEDRMKMGRPHLVPLSNQAKEVVGKIQKLTGHRDLVFPSSQNPLRPMSENTMLYALYRMGYHSKATVHGFRSTASTILYENRFRSEVVEMQLSHVEENKVKAAYNHAEYIDERIVMMQWWADHLDTFRP